MQAWRLCRTAQRALDGEGARLFGGRWNTPGVPVIYASESLSLAALEYLIHLDVAEEAPDLVALEIEIPDNAAVQEVLAADLPEHWARTVEPRACKILGDGWLGSGSSLLLRVPAAPVPEEHNILLNPGHSGFGRVKVVRERPFQFDPRLLA